MWVMSFSEDKNETIKRLSNQFRRAIQLAMDEGEFSSDIAFRRFPHGCCGDASDLLAQYLLDNGIITYYVYGVYSNGITDSMQSHAWLITEGHTIIDITGDQFKDDPEFMKYSEEVYIGSVDKFHHLFEVDEGDIHKNCGINALGDMCHARLNELYNTIMRYM